MLARGRFPAVLVSLAGVVLLVAGLALIYVPAGLIAAGVGLLVVGLLIDLDPQQPRAVSPALGARYRPPIMPVQRFYGSVRGPHD